MTDMREGTCPMCTHKEIIEAVPGEFGAKNQEVPVAVTYGNPSGTKREWDQPYGLLHMYVCRRCGYTQWYASYPGSIPVGPAFRTRVIKGKEEGPYR
jgi:hypothetical protein